MALGHHSSWEDTFRWIVTDLYSWTLGHSENNGLQETWLSGSQHVPTEQITGFCIIRPSALTFTDLPTVSLKPVQTYTENQHLTLNTVCNDLDLTSPKGCVLGVGPQWRALLVEILTLERRTVLEIGHWEQVFEGQILSLALCFHSLLQSPWDEVAQRWADLSCHRIMSPCFSDSPPQAKSKGELPSFH